MSNINKLCAIAEKSGFEQYGDFREEDSQHLILTCTRGKFSGEVIDIYYDYYSGNVAKIEHSTQFKDQISVFRFTTS